MRHDCRPMFGSSWLHTAVGAAFMGFLHLAPTNYGIFDLPAWLCLIGIVGLWGVVYRGIVVQRSAILATAHAAWAGFWYYAVTIYWVGTALILGKEGTGATLLAAAGSLGCTALFFPWWSLAAIGARWLTKQWTVLGPLGFAVCWSVSDLLLGDFVYGIPLGSMSAAVLDTPLAGSLEVLGTHGVSFLIVWLGCAIGAMAMRPAPMTVLTPVAALLTVMAVGLAPLGRPNEPSGPPSRVATVQFGEMLHLTKDTTEISAVLEDQARTALDLGAELVVFPETTLLGAPAEAGIVERMQALLSDKQAIVLGGRQVMPRGELGSEDWAVDVYNTAFVITKQEAVPLYNKTHLTIFGEYMPGVFRIMGFDVIGGGGGIAQGDGLSTAALGALPPFLLTICYEGLMSGPMQRAIGDAQWVINLSNEHLFQTTVGAAILQRYNRMRSRELGVPTVRSTMTGYTGLIDAQGDVVREVPLYKRAIVAIDVPKTEFTLYHSVGGWPLFGIQIIGIMAILLSRLGVTEVQNGRHGLNGPRGENHSISS